MFQLFTQPLLLSVESESTKALCCLFFMALSILLFTSPWSNNKPAGHADFI